MLHNCLSIVELHCKNLHCTHVDVVKTKYVEKQTTATKANSKKRKTCNYVDGEN